jgi:lysophospholipase L1-like esterase
MKKYLLPLLLLLPSLVAAQQSNFPTGITPPGTTVSGSNITFPGTVSAPLVTATTGFSSFPSNLTVVSIGTSITQGVNITHSAWDTPTCITSITDTTCGDFTSQTIFMSALKGRVSVKENLGISGNTIAQVNSTYAAGAHLFSPSVTGTPAILYVEAGANDLSNSLATMETDMTALLATVSADTWNFIGCATVMPQNSTQAIDTNRILFNEWLRTQSSCTAIFDNARLINNTFSTLLSDKLHPAATGAKYIASAMNTVLIGRSQILPTDDHISSYTVADNVRLSTSSLQGLTTGTGNVAAGDQAGVAISSGTNNVAIGSQSLLTLTTTSGNTCVGYQTCSLSTGANNVAIGNLALAGTTTATELVAIGKGAMDAAVTGVANGSVAIGSQAMNADTSGASNVAIGYQALLTNISGNQNVAVGQGSLQLQTGTGSTAVGYNSMQNNTASNNVAYGSQSLNSNTSGASVTGIGFKSLFSNGTGARNTGLGFLTGDTGTGGNANISGSDNTYLGYQAGPGSATQFNFQTVIGSGATCIASNEICLGRSNGSDTVLMPGPMVAATHGTATKCAAVGTSASPSVAACVAAAAGVFSCATNAVTTCTVTTTAVNVGSTVIVTQDASTTTGTLLGVTCNVTASTVNPSFTTAKVAATSFSFGLTQPSVNPDCFQYMIFN